MGMLATLWRRILHGPEEIDGSERLHALRSRVDPDETFRWSAARLLFSCEYIGTDHFNDLGPFCRNVSQELIFRFHEGKIVAYGHFDATRCPDFFNGVDLFEKGTDGPNDYLIHYTLPDIIDVIRDVCDDMQHKGSGFANQFMLTAYRILNTDDRDCSAYSKWTGFGSRSLNMLFMPARNLYELQNPKTLDVPDCAAKLFRDLRLK